MVKKTLYIASGVVILAGATLFAAEMDHTMLHDMMMKMNGPKTDTRTELKVPEPMKVMQKTMMRAHLDSIGEITGALASNDLKKAAEVARENLGWNPAQEKMCSTFSDSTGGREFYDLGKAMHAKADELARDAEAGDRDRALSDMAGLVKRCNACHDRFRH